MVEQIPYPVNNHGFPIPVQELGLPDLRSETNNNHHLNFCANLFGTFAISETFRNLDSFQTMMPYRTHEVLHQRYSGLRLPTFGNMLDRIEQAQAEGEHLKIRTLGHYVLHDITDVHIKTLHAAYNSVRSK